MAELRAREAWEGLGLPIAAGGARLAPLPGAEVLSIAPFGGREAAVAGLLGAPLAVGRAVAAAEGRELVWAGFGQWMLRGPGAVGAAARLAGAAAVTEQGDGWCGLMLGGAEAREVLARLVPLDLDPAAFPVGSAARSLLRHVPLLLIARAEGFELQVPRSYARTAVREIGAAMRGMGARG